VRFTIVPTVARPLKNSLDRNIAISPDGRQLVYVAASAQNEGPLMLRAIDQLDASPLRGIVGRYPFFSPDGKWMGFFFNNELKKVSIAGGLATTVCRMNATARGGSWGPDDTIVFATSDPTSGLFRVSAAGGEPTMLTKPDIARHEGSHVHPSFLPDGRAVVFRIVGSAEGNDQVAVLDLKTGRRKTLLTGGGDSTYVDTGHLVYSEAGALRAVRFDPTRLETLGDPVSMVADVMSIGVGSAEFAVSRTGTLVYVPAGVNSQRSPARSLVWVDRRGGRETIPAPTGTYVYPRLSPDGTRVALDVLDQQRDIWIWDFNRRTMTRLTFDRGAWPVWTPDGHRIVFASGPTGRGGLFWRAADGSGVEERLTTSSSVQVPNSFSPDGRSLVLMEQTPTTGDDLRVLTLKAPSGGGGTVYPETTPLIHTPALERAGDISPDGHWIAYYSNESGQNQVYVRPFPGVDEGRWQISTNGGSRPAWAGNGRELFYLDNDTALMAVSVQTAPTFSANNPTKLFDGLWYAGQAGRTYDVSRDGQRFLMITTGDPTSASANIVVVLHWLEELKRRVPTK
jgi:serine/threonine-protein kinase